MAYETLEKNKYRSEAVGKIQNNLIDIDFRIPGNLVSGDSSVAAGTLLFAAESGQGISDLCDKAHSGGATLGQHFISSLQVAISGYVLGVVIGVPLGIIMGWFKKADIIFRPVFDLLKPIPPIALIPVMIVIFGISLKAKAVLVFFSTVIPCILNSYSGIKQTSSIHIWVAQTFGASNLQRLFTVAIPSALPMIFAGLRVALGSSWMALVAAELLASTKGLGYLISVGRSLLRSDLIIVGMLCLGLIGIVNTFLFDLIEKKIVRGGKEK